jgi:hypothetical protein
LQINLANRMVNPALVTLDNVPVIFGGSGRDADLSSVFRLDLAARAWVSLPNMAAAREKHSVVAVPECWLCNNCPEKTTSTGASTLGTVHQQKQ